MKVNPRIIEHLGSDLITSAAVAVVELIKNSIDAHSKRVNIQFFDGIGQIEKNDKIVSVSLNFFANTVRCGY